MPIVLDRLDREDVPSLWHVVEPLIAMGIDAVTTEVTTEFIRAEALADRRIIWVAVDSERRPPLLAAASMGQRETNDGLVIFIDAIGGFHREEWLVDCLAELERRAKAIGAVKVELEGRLGWARVLPGYRPKRIVLEKDLT